MKKHSAYLLIALHLIAFSLSYAQSGKIINWATDSDALPQNSVKSIAPDKYGYLWLTTENGLVRYDGQDFKVFNSQTSGYSNNRFVSIRGEISSDSLYTFNDYQNDVVLITSREVKILRGPERVKAMLPSIDRNLPFISHGTPSILFDVRKRPYIIPATSNSYYLIAHDTINYYNKFDQLIFRRPFIYESNERFFLLENTLYYLDENGNYAAFCKDQTYEHKLPFSATEEKMQLYWNVVANQAFIYHDKNLFELSSANCKLTPELLIPNQNLTGDNLNSIYHDKKNRLIFLGSLKSGLGSYRTDHFSPISLSGTVKETKDIFYAIYPLSENTVVSSSGIVLNKEKVVKDLDFISDNLDLVVDKNKDIWVSQLAYLYRYTAKSDYKKYEKWFFPHGISSIYMGKDYKIWFSTSGLNELGGTLYYFTPEENPAFIKVVKTEAKITFLKQSDSSILWIGTRSGLLKLDFSNNKLYKFNSTRKLNIRSIHVSEQSNVWFTTYENGFFLLQNKKVYTFPMDNRNYLLSSHCIIEDQSGYFWITTNKGLFKTSKKTLLESVFNHTVRPYYHYYNKSYGFLSNEFNGGCQPCSAELKNGMIFIPSINGVVSFDPKTTNTALPDSDIYIDNILVNGHKIPVKDTISLNRNFERVTLYFSSPYFGNPANQNYEVSLEGPETQSWRPLANYNNVSFTSLPPGSYICTVRKIAGFDGTFIYKTIVFDIQPAIWQTIWFKGFILMFFLIVIYYIYNLRINVVRRRNMLLERTVSEHTKDLKNTISTLRLTKENLNNQIENNTKIIRNITHDIKSPLKFMAMASKFMYESYEDNKDELKENIKAIYTSSAQMYNLVSNLLDYSKIYLDEGDLEQDEFDLHSLISEKVTLFSSIANAQRTVIKNLITPETILKKNRHLFSIVIHNLLDNATKFTNHGKILITNYSVGNKLYIEINDTGKGMRQEMLNHYKSFKPEPGIRQKNSEHVGMYIVAELMLVLNAEVKLESKENVGTTITLIFNII